MSVQLPRLMYIGDVPVASTIAGAVQLYRLLFNYPTDRLHIIQGDPVNCDAPSMRLPGVVYRQHWVTHPRLLRSRFCGPTATALHLTTPLRAAALLRHVRAFQPEALLTVAFGFSWLTADLLSRWLPLPLHFIIHDDWPTANHLPLSLRDWGAKHFSDVFARAQTRLCISPYMAQTYEARYGYKTDVLYPLRDPEIKSYSKPPERLHSVRQNPTLGYFGSISTPSAAMCLSRTADVLYSMNGRLLIYSDMAAEEIAAFGLNKPNIEIRARVPLTDLYRSLREEADGLLLYMEFSEVAKPNMIISFPSKLTDYTMIGLPILIWGPEYCSAVRWSCTQGDFAEVVSQDSLELLKDGILRMMDPARSILLAQNAIDTGRLYFEHSRITDRFYSYLTAS